MSMEKTGNIAAGVTPQENSCSSVQPATPQASGSKAGSTPLEPRYDEDLVKRAADRMAAHRASKPGG